MNRCLKDKTLLLLQGKEGNSAQRAHLTQCAACAARYEDLRRDLMAISSVLREKPPAQAMAHRFRPGIIRWAPATLGMALALMLSWQGMRMWISSAPQPTGTAVEEVWSLPNGFSSSLFLLSEAMAVERTVTTDVAYDLAAAVLEADRPCEWYDLPLLGRMESGIEEPELAEGNRPASCIEVRQDSEKVLQKRKIPKNVS